MWALQFGETGIGEADMEGMMEWEFVHFVGRFAVLYVAIGVGITVSLNARIRRISEHLMVARIALLVMWPLFIVCLMLVLFVKLSKKDE